MEVFNQWTSINETLLQGLTWASKVSYKRCFRFTAPGWEIGWSPWMGNNSSPHCFPIRVHSDTKFPCFSLPWWHDLSNSIRIDCFPVCAKFLVWPYPCVHCAKGFSDVRYLFSINFVYSSKHQLEPVESLQQLFNKYKTFPITFGIVSRKPKETFTG